MGRRGPVAFADSLSFVSSQIAAGKLNNQDALRRGGRSGTYPSQAAPLAAEFDGASFEAKLYELKHMPSGEIRMVLVIPESDRAEGTKMADAYAHALLVTVGKRRS